MSDSHSIRKKSHSALQQFDRQKSEASSLVIQPASSRDPPDGLIPDFLSDTMRSAAFPLPPE
jgi:hypothetical protein